MDCYQYSYNQTQQPQLQQGYYPQPQPQYQQCAHGYGYDMNHHQQTSYPTYQPQPYSTAPDMGTPGYGYHQCGPQYTAQQPSFPQQRVEHVREQHPYFDSQPAVEYHQDDDRLNHSRSSGSYTHNPYEPVQYDVPTSVQRDRYVGSARDLSIPKGSRVTPAQFEQMVGSFFSMARTPHGSSHIQAALRENDAERRARVCEEILPHAGILLLDMHGCYVIRTLMEQMSKEELTVLVSELSKDESLFYQLSTGTLHSRRIIQYLLEKLDSCTCEFLGDVMYKRCSDVSRTQQGCIVIQRVLDIALPHQKAAIFEIVQRNVVSFAMDPYANYVVQYMFEACDKETNSTTVRTYFAGSVPLLACDKYASNVIEKALHYSNADAQHLIVKEMYNAPSDRLIAMIQDSYGNYIIQTTIALCGFRDVYAIAEKLRPVLHMTPYGYKIASKIERRLKGKTLVESE